MSDSDKYPIKHSAGDIAHAITKAGISTIPIVGGAAVEIFQFLMQAPLARRQDMWIQQLGENLLELQEGGIKLENLQHNEQFISAVLKATQAAMRTHQAEKLAALRNAIGNVARGQIVDDTLLHVLLSCVDDLSEMHLRVLQLCSEPKVPIQWKKDSDKHSVMEMITYNISELQNSDITQQLMADLINRGLITVIFSDKPFNELTQSCSTSLGESLLRMIKG